jgi:hypothetical protein
MTRNRCTFAFLASLMLAPAVMAGVPTHTDFELQARAAFASNPSGTYNLPPGVFFNSVTPDINDAGQIAFKVSPVGTAHGLWFGSSGQGQIVFTTAADAFMSDARMNNAGYVVFPVTFTSPNGIYFYDHIAQAGGYKTNLPLGATTWGTPQVNDDSYIGHRGNFAGSGQFYWSYDGSNSASGAFHVVETGVDPNSPYSFLFTPSFNNNRQIAGKVRIGPGTGEERPDQIRIFNADGSSVLIAEDQDSNPTSPFDRFDNSVSLTNNGWVAFVARTQPSPGGPPGGNVRGVYISNGVTTIEIATTNHSDVSNIESFSAVANDNGLVAFRAFDGSGLRSIFVGDGTELRRVVGNWDVVPTDAGPAWIARPDASPVFGGSVAINNNGDIAFNASLTPEGDSATSWGTGMFIAYADAAPGNPADLNGDGVVDVLDLLILLDSWGACKDCSPGACPADFNNDCNVDVLGLLFLLDNWG